MIVPPSLAYPGCTNAARVGVDSQLLRGAVFGECSCQGTFQRLHAARSNRESAVFLADGVARRALALWAVRRDLYCIQFAALGRTRIGGGTHHASTALQHLVLQAGLVDTLSSAMEAYDK